MDTLLGGIPPQKFFARFTHHPHFSFYSFTPYPEFLCPSRPINGIVHNDCDYAGHVPCSIVTISWHERVHGCSNR